MRVKRTIAILIVTGLATAGVAMPQTDSSLLNVKRIYVELAGDDPITQHLRDILIAGLQATKRFIITENRERANAILKGSIKQEKTRVVRGSSERIGVGGVSAAADREAAALSGVVVGEQEADISSDVRREITIAVRILNLDGDVLWATVQESKGGKFKRPEADAVDKVVKALLQEIARLEKKQAAQEQH